MSRDTLTVTPVQDKWTIRTDNEQGDADIPEYDSREAAIDAAIASAQNSAKRGRTGTVHAEDGQGRSELVREIFPSAD